MHLIIYLFIFLGLCILYNNNTVAGSGQEDLVTLVEKRVGADTFLDKIGDIPKHEGFNKVGKTYTYDT